MFPYQYQPLASTNAVRVAALEPAETTQAALRCSIIQYSRTVELARADNSRHYSAVSYAWGAPDFSRVLVCASDDAQSGSESYLSITPHVDALLRHLRKPSKRVYLWIDALCLNQQDGAEKGQQVPLMGQIYRDAKKVHIWLGEDPGRVAPSVFALFRYLNNKSSSLELSGQGNDLLAAFFQRPWFGRRWIIQEVALARHALVHWGSASIELSWITSALSRIRQSALGAGLYGPRMLEVSTGRPARERDVLRMLWDLDSSECSDPRDRVAALLGLASGEHQIQLDYDMDDWKQVYQRLATRLINQSRELGHLVIYHLLVFGPACESSDGKLDKLTWVPNWSVRRRHRFFKYPDFIDFNAARAPNKLFDTEYDLDRRDMSEQIEKWVAEWDAFNAPRTTGTGTRGDVDVFVKGNALEYRWRFNPRGIGFDGATIKEAVKLHPTLCDWRASLAALQRLNHNLLASFSKTDDPYRFRRQPPELWDNIASLLARHISLRSQAEDTETFETLVPDMVSAIDTALDLTPDPTEQQMKDLGKIGTLLAGFSLIWFVLLSGDSYFSLGPHEAETGDLLVPFALDEFPSDDSEFAPPLSLCSRAPPREITRVGTCLCLRPAAGCASFTPHPLPPPVLHFGPRTTTFSKLKIPRCFVNQSTKEEKYEVPPRKAHFLGMSYYFAREVKCEGIGGLSSFDIFGRQDTGEAEYYTRRARGERPLVISII